MKPRNGKFWLPLICLFHGFRMQEAAQLNTEDLKVLDGILYFHVRKHMERGSKAIGTVTKRLKNKHSERIIPVHSELLKIGFEAFLEMRRQDTSSGRLFPDLRPGATGSLSNPFSKWAQRFLDKALGEDRVTNTVFHSFRHNFRDALRDGHVSDDDARQLGGWKELRTTADSSYGHGHTLKRYQEWLEQADFGDLDLSHLYPKLARRRTRPPT
jgi:integrase